MTSKQRKQFIKKVAAAVRAAAPGHGIAVASPVIAQCIVESGWGESRLASQYHNYFGLKAGTAWTGRSVSMRTNEEYEPGQVTEITDAFRAYDSLEDGVAGYFELISLPRYENLKGVTDPETYCRLLMQDGYATDSHYADTLMAVIRENSLTKYDEGMGAPAADEETQAGSRTAQAYLDAFRGWIGCNEADGSYMEILDLYNSHEPRARGYVIQPDDEWCDCTVSAAAIKAGMADLIGTEVGVERHVGIFQEKGIWIEDGTVTPEPGDIIVFDWDSAAQPTNGFSDHIGVVEYAEGGTVHTIEGNSGGAVARRSYAVGAACIRGYARPRYDGAESTGNAENIAIAQEPEAPAAAPSKTPKYVARAACLVNVRRWAGTEHPNIASWPRLKRGDLVDVCDTVDDSDGEPWAYVRIQGRIFGFVMGRYLERV